MTVLLLSYFIGYQSVMISPTPLKMWMSVFVMATALFLAAYTVQRYFRQHRQHLLVAFAAHMVAILLFQAITFSETVVESPELMLRLINLSTAVFIWLALYTLLWFVLVYSDNEAWINRWTVGAAGGQILLLATVVTVWPEFLYEVDGHQFADPEPSVVHEPHNRLVSLLEVVGTSRVTC